ncbi:PepSY domain-containing protein [Parapedobacter luteus]|nr:PepSY-like domain-containing protein [Parapedobacter luteus]
MSVRKRWLILTVGLLLCSYTWAGAQEIKRSQVPSIILNRFETEFRNARDVEWERKPGLYEVEFEIGPWEHKVHYDRDGMKVYHDREIGADQLPLMVKDAIRRKYPGCSLKDMKHIDRKGQITYEVEIKTADGRERELVLDEKGAVRSDRRD